MGIALGCDYPTAHMVISESIPSKNRGKLVLSAFGFQAIGALVGTAVGLCGFVQKSRGGGLAVDVRHRRDSALLVLASRFFIPDSGHWLVCRGKVREAEREVARLLQRKPPYPKKITLDRTHTVNFSNNPATRKRHYGVLFSKRFRRVTILASVPWFLQDLSTYGIGIFTPTILTSVIGPETRYAHNLADIIHNDIIAAKGAAFIDLMLLIGIIIAILAVDRIGRMRLQVFGFAGCALGLLLASFSINGDGSTDMFFLFAGFMLFSLMTNLGPNAMTYLIAGEVFPTHIRGKGAGFSASFAKIGAVLTAFLFPVLLADLGTKVLLYALVGASLLGAVVTLWFRVETKGINLEELGGIAENSAEARQTTSR